MRIDNSPTAYCAVGLIFLEKLNINFKELVLAILSIISSIAVFWVWHERIVVILGSEFHEYISLVLPVAGLCFSAALFSLGLLFIRDARIVYPTAFIALGAPYLLLSPDSLVWGTFGLSILLTIFAVYRVRSEYALSIGFSTSKILRDGLPLYFTIAALLISVMYVQALNPTHAEESIVPRPVLNYTLQFLAKNSKITESLGIPAIDPDTTVDQVIQNFIHKELAKQNISPNKISDGELRHLVREQEMALAKQYDITIEEGEKVGDVFNRAVQNYINRLTGPYKKYLPFAVGAAFFLALKTLTLPLYYLTLLLVYILIKLLLSVNILKEVKENMEVERIRLR